MKTYLYALAVVMLSVTAFFSPEAAAQTQEPVDLNVLAEEEADKYQKLLDLEDWQTFYVDSTLKHDFTAMMAEYAELQKSKVSNTSMYMSVKDKWWDKIDESYRRFFTDEQWEAYLKTGAGKAQKARAKRKAKAEGKK